MPLSAAEARIASRRMLISRFRMTGSRDSGPHGAHSRLLPLTLTALGVVYGDIRTGISTLRESFYGSHSAAEPRTCSACSRSCSTR